MSTPKISNNQQKNEADAQDFWRWKLDHDDQLQAVVIMSYRKEKCIESWLIWEFYFFVEEKMRQNNIFSQPYAQVLTANELFSWIEKKKFFMVGVCTKKCIAHILLKGPGYVLGLDSSYDNNFGLYVLDL